MYNLSKICCICLSNTTFLYKSNILDREDKMKLIDKLNFTVFEKNYAQENIVRNVCDDCKHMIKTGYKFKKMCQKNYNTLQQYIEQKKNKPTENKIVNTDSEVKSAENYKEKLPKNDDLERKTSNSASTSSTSSEIGRNSKEKHSKNKNIDYKRSNTISVPSSKKTYEKEIKSSDKYAKEDKTIQRRKSVSNNVEKPKIMNNSSKPRDQIRNTQKSISEQDIPSDSKPKNQINHRKMSSSSVPEFVIKPPQEKADSQSSDGKNLGKNNEPTLSFNKKYYGFTTSEIQNAHEYLFNIKILLKFVTLSNAVETQTVTEGINKRIKDLKKKVYSYDISKYHTLLDQNPCEVKNTSKKTADNKQNKRKIASKNTVNKKMKDNTPTTSSSENLDLFSNNTETKLNYDDSEIVDDLLSAEDVINQDADSITALPSEETTTEDHQKRKTYPGPNPEMAQDQQIHPYISKAIESTEELSKIISDPTAVEKKTLAVPVLPTESLRPENLNNSFQQFNEAMNEVRSIINKERQFECQFCDRTFTRKQFLLLHYIVHCVKKGSVYKCAVCEKPFEDELAMKQHLLTHNDTPVPQCYVCNRSFTREYALALHILASHKGIRAFKCHICDKSFARHSTLKIHLKRHSAYKDYQCKVCGTFLASKGGLQRHMAIHTGNKPYLCKLCDKAYAYRCQLTDHIVRQHYNKDIKEKNL